MKLGTVVVLVVLIAASLSAFAIAWTNPRLPQEFAICAHLTPTFKRFGLNTEVAPDGGAKFSVGQESSIFGTTDSRLQETIIRCIEATGRNVQLADDLVRIPQALPVGQIANQWKRDAGQLQLTLASANEALQNLRIGPATGPKHQVMRDWCTSECVVCEPNNPRKDTTEVRVALKPNARTERVEHSPGWPPNVKGADGRPVNVYQPWELIDAQGQRYVYQCSS